MKASDGCTPANNDERLKIIQIAISHPQNGHGVTSFTLVRRKVVLTTTLLCLLFFVAPASYKFQIILMDLLFSSRLQCGQQLSLSCE